MPIGSAGNFSLPGVSETGTGIRCMPVTNGAQASLSGSLDYFADRVSGFLLKFADDD
jgi:hypothetical protein